MNNNTIKTPVPTADCQVTVTLNYSQIAAFPMVIAELAKSKSSEELESFKSNLKEKANLSGWEYSVAQMNQIYTNIMEQTKSSGQVEYKEFNLASPEKEE